MSRSDNRFRPASGRAASGAGRSEELRHESRTQRPREHRDRGSTSPEYQALRDIGRLRMVSADDLVRHLWRGDEGRAQRDLRRMADQGLIRRHWIRRRDGDRWAALTLTERGRRRAQAGGQSGQRYYSGFVKRREADHDAAIYRAYLDAASRLQDSGRRVRRIVIDHELKSRYQKALAKAKGPLHERQQEAARRTGLKIQDGKAVIPDVRLEYEGAGGERGFVDLEVASDHYRSSHIAEKARAGFAVYGSDGRPGAPVKDGPDLLEDVFAI